MFKPFLQRIDFFENWFVSSDSSSGRRNVGRPCIALAPPERTPRGRLQALAAGRFHPHLRGHVSGCKTLHFSLVMRPLSCYDSAPVSQGPSGPGRSVARRPWRFAMPCPGKSRPGRARMPPGTRLPSQPGKPEQRRPTRLPWGFRLFFEAGVKASGRENPGSATRPKTGARGRGAATINP